MQCVEETMFQVRDELRADMEVKRASLEGRIERIGEDVAAVKGNMLHAAGVLDNMFRVVSDLRKAVDGKVCFSSEYEKIDLLGKMEFMADGIRCIRSDEKMLVRCEEVGNMDKVREFCDSHPDVRMVFVPVVMKVDDNGEHVPVCVNAVKEVGEEHEVTCASAEVDAPAENDVPAEDKPDCDGCVHATDAVEEPCDVCRPERNGRKRHGRRR